MREVFVRPTLAGRETHKGNAILHPVDFVGHVRIVQGDGRALVSAAA